MKISGVRYKFERENIEAFRFSGKGIYVLFNSYKDIVYIGKSDESLEKALLSHLSSEEKIDAHYFMAWLDDNPETRFNRIIEAYRTAFFGRIPEGICDGEKQLT